jgi:hypothetical protein
MATAYEYQQIILDYDWTALKELWKQIESRSTPNWEAGKAFEYLVVRMFELDGATVKYPYPVDQMEQIDGVVYLDASSCIIESKDYRDDKVGVEPIYKLRNQLLRRPSGVVGSVFSRTGFTEAAITLASFTMPQTVLLWEGKEIEVILQEEHIKAFFVKKLRYCIETGFPNYDIRAEIL